MKPISINCPSCGAPKEIFNPGIITSRCEYCGNAIYWDQGKVKKAGKESHLPEGFTRLYTGAGGFMFQQRFVVLGRARYGYDKGFWDEWCIETEKGKTLWLTEDNHELSLQEKVYIKVGDFNFYKPGMTITAKRKKFHIQETGFAKCIGLEGDLPKLFEVGEGYQYVDGSSLNGKYNISIEYDDDQPSVYIGRWLKYSSIKLDDEGEEW